MHKITLIALLFVFLVSCSPAPVQPTPQPTPDISAIQTEAVETYISNNPTATPIPPTATMIPPTSTPVPPTETAIPPTETAQAVTGDEFAWNYVAEQESGGMKIEILRINLANKSAIADVLPFHKLKFFDDTPVVVEFVFRVTNNSDKVLSIFPDQGTVVIASEQISLRDFMQAGFGDNYSGKIYPGVSAIGGIWFGLKRTELAGVRKILLMISAPYDENMTDVGQEYRFEIDLSERKLEPLPSKFE